MEKYIRENEQDPAAKFLLAYHYLCVGQHSAAKMELERVVSLEPKDQLSGQLLKALEGGADDRPPAAQLTPS